KAALEERRQGFIAAGTPGEIATRLALTEIAELIPDIALIAKAAGAEITLAAQAFFTVSDAFRIARIEEASHAINPSDYYDGLALSRATDMIDAARRDIAISALTSFTKSADPVAAWLEAGGERIARIRERLQG